MPIFPKHLLEITARLRGEVKHCLIQSYSNKGHAGFIGDSILGEWVNLGAGTTTSNLKLSYGAISSHNYQTDTTKNTGCQFLGSILGIMFELEFNHYLNVAVLFQVDQAYMEVTHTQNIFHHLLGENQRNTIIKNPILY